MVAKGFAVDLNKPLVFQEKGRTSRRCIRRMGSPAYYQQQRPPVLQERCTRAVYAHGMVGDTDSLDSCGNILGLNVSEGWLLGL
ncbi:hypothetical protein MLD38_010365 [Melastoma candidum]|uniref:Uncharacterized protein n=1 Tax=Melastoma candidum TaxID=119954 RepID=A0ACB9QZL7_9MYRT|nr:hypothetical protein MLD38_010365 [Melastoma candidum]